jgi:hypothetical protein
LSGTEFEILSGLPGSGPPAVPFPANNLGFSEGLIVRFRPPAMEAWIGNFRCGDNDHSAVHLHPDRQRIIVIAGGSDYLVNPNTKMLDGHTAENVSFSREVPELEIIVFGDYIRFWAEGRDGRKWTTARLSWDGFEAINVVKRSLTGRWYSAIEESFHEFRLDLVSGNVVGPTFEADFRRVKPITGRAD